MFSKSKGEDESTGLKKWKIVLVFELLGRSNGVGFMLSLHFSNFAVYNVLAYAFSFIAVVMMIESFILRPMERRATRWRM